MTLNHYDAEARAFAARACGNKGRATPVRNTVRDNWHKIAAALAAGASLGAIRRELDAEGHDVGSSKSGFNKAVRFVADEMAKKPAVRPHGGGFTDSRQQSAY
ncbi:MAG TPA: hypothetical protein VI199_06835 [Novosphingobium sp.]